MSYPPVQGRGLTKAPVIPVSLVVPMHNESATLTELFLALMRLDSRPAEVVFVDTGSADDSVALVNEWLTTATTANMSVRLVQLDHGYPGAARNVGVRVASQPWIAFLDAGISPANDWLSVLWRFRIENNAKAVLGYCRFVAAGALERIVCALSYGYQRKLPVLPASLFHRELFDNVVWFDPALRSGEDLLWLAALRRAGITVRECPSAIVEYSHFPDTLGHAMRKWFIYECSAAGAGIGGGLRSGVRFSLLVLCIILPFAPIHAGACLAVYALVRGVFDPLRRAGWQPWWGRRVWLLPLAPLIAAALDLSAAFGRIAAWLGRRV